LTFLLFFFVLGIALLVWGAIYQALGTRGDRKRFPAPGIMIEGAGAPLHVHTTGAGSPAVLLEAGISASSMSWSRVQPELSKFTTVCSYDRAGLAWSGASSQPRTPEQILKEIRVVAETLPKPFVFVGHSFGGLLGCLYAAAHPEDVCGLVLVDPALSSEWAQPSAARLRMLGRGVSLSRRGALLCRLGMVRFALRLLTSGSRFLPKIVARASSTRGGASVIERLVGEVRKMPEHLWPSIQSHWCRPESFLSMAAHLEALPAVAAAATRVETFQDLPLTVISGAHLSPEQQAEHAELARRSSRGRHLVAPAGAHWVQLDQPGLVVAAIRAIL
jgi:pimeloyl-ACP methyl ester carboxylesterase